MSRRAKPKSPEAILAERARDFTSVGLQAEAAGLAAHRDVEVGRQTFKTLSGARRLDAFDALREGMAKGAYDAVRRLEADIGLRAARIGTSSGGMERIDCAGSGAVGDASTVNRLDRALAAGRRAEHALGQIGPRDALLLSELIEPSLSGRPWRETVRAMTGEDNPVAQGAVVRAACANLAMAYEAKA